MWESLLQRVFPGTKQERAPALCCCCFFAPSTIDLLVPTQQRTYISVMREWHGMAWHGSVRRRYIGLGLRPVPWFGDSFCSLDQRTECTTAVRPPCGCIMPSHVWTTRVDQREDEYIFLFLFPSVFLPCRPFPFYFFFFFSVRMHIHIYTVCYPPWIGR